MPHLQQDPQSLQCPDFIPVCVIVDKVYFQCQQRECIENVRVRLPHDCESKVEFLDVIFNPGEIINGTLVITDIPSRPNFRRVRFKVRVTFIVKIKNLVTGAIENIEGELPPIQKDIVLYIPDARDEFTFKIVVETLSQVLSEPIIDDGVLIFTIGVFLIIKVVGKVQLLIPEFGFCPAPPECEEFLPTNICDEFEMEDFPDFFPPQLETMP
ncbi:hypothetical protein [Alkaliphilus oremlandii]|uniref:SipL SPOCS domain-containing protein n=1 Tax=Alkaliphilus oremlandii (strain OhILAs) TaxID=350688 RepID=A8MGJ0_ALKOO|nr:hypothetical protein [Alkaliphilus oremlandii]ABW19213.1 conserved hypothetical protein [Alkaliphilus oremlandii OhILAs]